MTNELKQKRDELAYSHSIELHGNPTNEMDLLRSISIRHSFASGFNAAVEIMEKRIKELSDRWDEQHFLLSESEFECSNLKEKNRKLVEALKFYASAWERGDFEGDLLIRKLGSTEPFESVHDRARIVLKEVGAE